MRSSNGTSTAEDTRTAHQTAHSARESAVQTLLDAAARIRASSVSSRGFVTDDVGQLAHELELNANYLQSRDGEPRQKGPSQASGWLKLAVAFGLGLIVGWLLRAARD